MTILFQFFIRLRNSLRQSPQSQLAPIVVLLGSVLVVGTVAYSLLEKWSLLDALYATTITVTTVGYGDLSPQSTAGRVFSIFFTVIAIAFGGYALSSFAVYTIESKATKKARKFRRRIMKQISGYEQHYILCGANLISTRIASDLTRSGATFVVIDGDEEQLKSTLLFTHPEYFRHKLQTLVDFYDFDLSEFEDLTLPQVSERVEVPYLLADPTDDSVLLQAGIDRAAGLVATFPDDRDNLSIVIGARNLAKRAENETLRIMSSVNDPRNMRKMYIAGADFVRIPTVVSGREMATHIMHPEVGHWWYSQLAEEDENNSTTFKQVELQSQTDWIGKTIGELHQSDRVMVISVKRDGEFMSPPAHDLTLKADDIAIVLG